ncbi:MAG: photosynthetic complex assembly protein PuhC [Paracoccaceae bacterium]
MSQSRAHQIHARADELVPTILLRLVFALVLAVLALVTVAKLSGRPLEAMPPVAEVIKERAIFLSGDDAGAARVLDQNGAVLVDLPAEKGGFIAGVERVIHRERMKRGADQAGPVLLQLREGNRLSLLDPETGWSAELMGFGADNTRSFARLLDQQ